MAAKTVARALSPSGNLHTSGIYADMSVDGPEIGTLVVVFDRAKNLPNRKTVGKQDPYCAARLGKEAKKTETDRRGGQTPRWDQELRFTVHDSADYHNLKVSVFNDDRKTDLIGETWVFLDDVLKHGGGQADSWHNLNFRGKYAGELRIELTFYDSRPKEERPQARSRKQSMVDGARTNQDLAPQGPKQMPLEPRRPLPQPQFRQLPPEQPSLSVHQPTTVPRDVPSDSNTPPHLALVSGTHNFPSSHPFLNGYPSNVVDLPAESYSRSLPLPEVPSQNSNRGQEPWETNRSVEYDNHYQHHYNQSEREISHEDVYGGYTNYAHPSQSRRQGFGDYTSEPSPSWETESHDVYYEPQTYTPPARPPPQPMSQTHSAPHLGVEHVRHPPRDADRRDHAHSSASRVTHGSQLVQHLPTHGRQTSAPNGHGPIGEDSPPPPPPPVHRSSAPSGATLPYRAMPQPTNTPRRPLHVSTNADDLFEGYQSHQSPAWDSREPRSAHESATNQQHPPHYYPHRQNSAEAIMYHPQKQQSNDYGNPPPNYGSPPMQTRARYQRQSNGPASSPVGVHSMAPNDRIHQDQGRPTSYQGFTGHGPVEQCSPQFQASRDGSPLYQPQPTSPATRRPQGYPQTPPSATYARKEIKPRSPLDTTPKSDSFYSPDSFNAINPNATRSTPNLPSSKEPSPMYASQKGQNSGTDNTPSKAPPPSHELAKPDDGPIIGSDGRIKDPSDHLPVSSYAPEPEPKGKRPTTVVNIKNRFGPRDAPSITPPSRPLSHQPASSPVSPFSAPNSVRTTPEIKTSAAARYRVQRSSAGMPSSPLSPAGPNALNSPPQQRPTIPPKLPSMGNASGIEDYEPGGSMAALSDELDSIDIGPSRNSNGRQRKSRFGA